MFDDALKDYGLDRCSTIGQSLIIGVGPNEPLGEQVDIIPAAPQRVLFLDAAEQVDLLRTFLASPSCQHVQHLTLGSSHLIAEQKGSLDFTDAVAALAGHSLASLRSLSLGDMERLFNGHCYYGNVGDIAPVFAAAPNLQSLEVFGRFSLSSPVQHKSITDFSAIVDEIGVTGGPPSQSSLDNLLSSGFPMMRRLELWLEDGSDDLDFSLPETFFSGEGMPQLETFGIDELSPDYLAKTRQWARDCGVALHLE